MIRKANECSVKINENMRGGDGSVRMTSLISGPEELQNKGRLFNIITLEPGCSIGYHVHENETELFYIIKGTAIYNDGGEETPISVGDVAIVEPGNSHGIANRADETCELVALILYQ